MTSRACTRAARMMLESESLGEAWAPRRKRGGPGSGKAPAADPGPRAKQIVSRARRAESGADVVPKRLNVGVCRMRTRLGERRVFAARREARFPGKRLESRS